MTLVEYLQTTPPSLRAYNGGETMPMRDGDATFELRGENIRETDKAILVRMEGKDQREFWLPKSQLVDYPEENVVGVVIMSEWIAGEKGLLDTGPTDDEIPF